MEKKSQSKKRVVLDALAIGMAFFAPFWIISAFWIYVWRTDYGPLLHPDTPAVIRSATLFGAVCVFGIRCLAVKARVVIAIFHFAVLWLILIYYGDLLTWIFISCRF